MAEDRSGATGTLKHVGESQSHRVGRELKGHLSQTPTGGTHEAVAVRSALGELSFVHGPLPT